MGNLFDSDESLFGGGDAAVRRLQQSVQSFLHGAMWAGNRDRDVVAAAKFLDFLITRSLKPRTSHADAELEVAVDSVIRSVTGKHLPPEALFRD